MIRYLWDVLFVLFGLVIIRELCIRLNPMWVQTAQLFDQYGVTGKSNVSYQSNMNSLQQYQRYATPEGADRWLKRLIKQGEIDPAFVIDRLSMNATLQDDISAQVKAILASHAAPLSRSVTKRIVRKRMPMIWTTYPSELEVTISYTSPAGRNHYASSYVWNARELQRLDDKPNNKLVHDDAFLFSDTDDSVDEFAIRFSDQKRQLCEEMRRPNLSSVVKRDTLATSGAKERFDAIGSNSLDKSAQTDMSDAPQEVSTEAQQTALLAGKFQSVEPQCREYLATHKCWTGKEYTQLCGHQGKKKVPGCYIIQNQVTGEIYVGQSADLMRRVQEHLNGKQSGGDQLDYDIAVLGHDVLIKHIPLAKSGYLDLNEMERDLIRAYDCIEPKGYNKTRGNGY